MQNSYCDHRDFDRVNQTLEAGRNAKQMMPIGSCRHYSH